jgi:hypothetical protein
MPPVLSVPRPQQMPLELCSPAPQQIGGVPPTLDVPAAQHRPLEHISLSAVQSVPPAPTHPPQLELSLAGSTHKPPQLRSDDELQQMPPMLNCVMRQQMPPLLTSPVGQQMPLEQVSGGESIVQSVPVPDAGHPPHAVSDVPAFWHVPPQLI